MKINAEVSKRHVHRITVRVLGIDILIPLFVLFSSLGIQ